MPRYLFAAFLVASVCLALRTSGQVEGVQFMENRGQWNPAILFKGDIGDGQIFLRAGGFTYSLFSPADMRQYADYYHGAVSPDSALKIGAGQPTDKSMAPRTAFDRTLGYLPRRRGGVIHGQSYQVNFLHGSPHPVIMADHPSSAYYNFYIGNDPARWKSGIHAYGAVTYKSMYPDIDVRVYSDASQLKYDLIVYPGGNPKKVIMQYQGVNRLDIKQGSLIISTGVGKVTELTPYCYQIIGTHKVLVASHYLLKGDEVSFRVTAYNHSYPLIIDPNIIFASFTGSRTDNWGYTATYDSKGDMFLGGIVFGQGYPLFPTNPGPFQANYGGGTMYEGNSAGFDIGICKFDPLGKSLMYATYLGGSGNEQPQSLVVDPNDNLIVAGRTQSTDFPVTAKVGPGGGWDITVTKFNATGTALIGSIKIGGKANDGVNITDDRSVGVVSLLRNYGDDARSEVIVDASGNIYLVGSTESADFPIQGTVFQPTKHAQQDGLVMEIKGDCSGLIWSSFLGGNGDDAAYVLDLDASGNLYVAGATSSTDLPTSPGVIQSAFAGGLADGFIAQISGDGSTLMRLTYLGTSNIDEIYGLQLDQYGFVYINGTTDGVWPTTANARYPGMPVDGKQFICKLQPDLSSYVYSTVFGSPASTPNTLHNISPVAFLVDKCTNVYVSGWGGPIYPGDPSMYMNAGTAGLPTTANALQSTTDGRDFYFFVLKKDAASILYASYFGQFGGATDHVDGGTSRFDKNGIIYEAICANCGGGVVFPTTPGVWSPTNGDVSRTNQGCNEVGLKIAFFLAGVSVGLRTTSGDTSGCIPFSPVFEDTVRIAKSYDWNFGDGSPDTVTTAFELGHSYPAVGSYTVRLIAIDSTSCNIRDTTYMTVRARNDAASVDFNALKLPPCTSLSYRFNNTSVPAAGKPFGQSFLWEFGDGTAIQPSDTSSVSHAYASAGAYPVTLILNDTNYCNSPDSVTQIIRLSPLVKAVFATPSSGCAPYGAVFTNNSIGGLSFSWNFGDGSPASSDVNPTHLYSSPGVYPVTMVAMDSTTCNLVDSTSDTIHVFSAPVAAFTFSPSAPVENTATVFTNTSSGAIGYLWNFGDGTTDTTVNPSHIFPKTGTYEVCLDALDPAGCVNKICQPVSAIIVPKFDIPNAFSPNGDGINDIFKPRGFGISQFDMRIYNRWGQLVFESNDISQGWDGRFRGVLQPVDVYAYVVTISFSDGTSDTRTGSVTLLR